LPGLAFYIVDVFGEAKYTGNQLAVLRNTERLSEEGMQKIAREMNFSETTFILSDKKREGGFDVRIFTPTQELPFAGHPTLGTGFVILRHIQKGRASEVILNLKLGKIPVTAKYKDKEIDVLWMKQREPIFGKKIDRSQIAPVLGISEDAIDEAFPVEEVSTGIFAILVPLKSLDAVKRCKVITEKYSDLISGLDSKAILVFCREPQNAANDIHARCFALYYGVPEDPATGSANGSLAAYLVKNRYFGRSKVDVKVEQGYEIGRPSLLLLRAEEKKDGKITVNVGGKVFMIAEGQFL
jgi:trans-2,3-dihydro-3-hydroxyanthranilate isomerase